VAQNIQDHSSSNRTTDLRDSFTLNYIHVRRFTEKLCETLETEDYVIQSMPDVSPTKWHLAHTTWFFETFLFSTLTPEYVSSYPDYGYLFNSYYNSIGERHCRPKRGLISRPTVKEIYAYRAEVDESMFDLFETCDEPQLSVIGPILTLGLNHEQQHQELILTDIKHVFSCNPLHPVYRPGTHETVGQIPPLTWKTFSEQIAWIGYDGYGFCYDNEQPHHRELLHPFQLASRLITNAEYLQFMDAGGYNNPLLWLSDGWRTVQQEQWHAPFYWEQLDGRWHYMTLAGFREIDPTEPVCHVSYYEADAYARWAGARLATESEWEIGAQDLPIKGNFVEKGHYHPIALSSAQPQEELQQMYGDVWEWTASPYSPYPGFHPTTGAIGEYNGKFMCNQFVQRGGSCATSQAHIRPTYRNFFPADARWQFTGVRLAREVR
jgi:ergothioneine biosynthesis protein EgtB